MTLILPNKQECFFILEMMECSLIDYSYTEPWAVELIKSINTPPFWLCDLATKKYRGDQIKAIQGFVYSEPFEAGPADLEKFAVACFWLRYERRELSWATFLRMAGELLDRRNVDWECETPYHYLNVYEDAYFTPAAEERTKREYLQDHDLNPWIAEAKLKFAPFLQLRKSNKTTYSKNH
ncbi:MAG: hypothetical protein ACO1QB_18750 [Verrucomicrobiales bacterium]